MAPRDFIQGCGIALTAAFAAGCAGTDNPIEEGDPIPNTSIASCGDAMKDKAPPTGSFDGTLAVDDAQTTFAASVIWQASCPGTETDVKAQIEYGLTSLRLFDDDAGFPGNELGSTAISLGAVVTCVGAAPGVTDKGDLPSVSVTHLADACAEHQAMPTGMPLFAHVELVGKAVTCSNDEFDVLFRRKIGVDCPEP